MQTSWIALAFLLIARATIMELAPLATRAPNPSQISAIYELIFETDSTTEQTGSITLRCRDITAEDLDISEISFFLNRTSAADHSLREREDIRVVEVGTTGIKFNLTRRLEGSYTCGKRVDATNVRESPPKTLIGLQKIIPLLHSTKTNYTAMSGDRVVLQCPIQPGALLQQYSVRWEKDNTAIAEATNPQSVTTFDDARYEIDRATYSLIIDSVTINDTSSNYQCEISVKNPLTNSLEKLQPSPSAVLSLEVMTGPVSSLCQNPAPYELIFETDSTIEQTGSLTLRCRDSATAEMLDINEISFFLNHSSAVDPSLREREDIRVVEVGITGIKFNLTRRFEGYYTCGKKVDCTNVREISPKALISLQTTIPLMPLPQANYSAVSGDRVILQCPIQPGALLQQYSVKWTKDNTVIAEVTNPQSVTTVDDSQYKIDRATYSLIIDSATVNDTSSNYQCEVSVTNPLTNTLQVLQPSPQVIISLNVIADNEEPVNPADSTSKRLTDPVESELNDDPLMNLWCMCQRKRPPAP